MDLIKFLKTGGRARIHTVNNEYQTMFNEVIDSEHLTFMIPVDYHPYEGEEIQISCITEVGLLLFRANVQKAEKDGGVGVMTVKVVGAIKRVQNRSAYRAKLSIEVLIKIDPNAPNILEAEKDDKVPKAVLDRMRELRIAKGIPEGWIKTYTINISENGMLIRAENGTRLSGDLEIILIINQFGIHETITGIHGRLARYFMGGRKETDLFAGIEFLDLPDRVKTLLMKLVFQSQRLKKED